MDNPSAFIASLADDNDDPYQIKVVEWPEDKKTDIMLVHDDDLTGGSLDDDAWTVYFEITEVDFI